MEKYSGDFKPDRDWAWMVLAASFLIDFTVDGTLYSIGIHSSLYINTFVFYVIE